MKAKVWVVKKAVSGVPTPEHFKCIEEELPHCQDGEIIIEAEYVSVDPYIRYRLATTPVNECVTGSQVSRVIESKNSKYPVGALVVCYPGWRSRTLYSKEGLESAVAQGLLWPLSVGNLPKSLGLGILGMPGNTSFFGFLEICEPQPGETVVVNAAAGAVGSGVCQIAKIKGCRVVAFAGSKDKVEWLKELGCDFVYNYKTTKIDDALKEAAPNGVDCYFDNVGGDFSAQVMPHMNVYGRISVCGAISIYNEERSSVRNGCYNEGMIIWKQLKVEGFIVKRWANRWMEGINQMTQWVQEGKLKYKETISKGFENIPTTFIGLFTGDNTGKAIIQM